MITVSLILMIVGLVLFALAGLGVAEPPRFRFVAWGLFAVTLAAILAGHGVVLH